MAGRGISGYYGNGGPATNADFNYPIRLAMDALGRLYIADSENQRIPGAILPRFPALARDNPGKTGLFNFSAPAHGNILCCL